VRKTVCKQLRKIAVTKEPTSVMTQLPWGQMYWRGMRRIYQGMKKWYRKGAL